MKITDLTSPLPVSTSDCLGLTPPDIRWSAGSSTGHSSPRLHQDHGQYLTQYLDKASDCRISKVALRRTAAQGTLHCAFQ